MNGSQGIPLAKMLLNGGIFIVWFSQECSLVSYGPKKGRSVSVFSAMHSYNAMEQLKMKLKPLQSVFTGLDLDVAISTFLLCFIKSKDGKKK